MSRHRTRPTSLPNPVPSPSGLRASSLPRARDGDPSSKLEDGPSGDDASNASTETIHSDEDDHSDDTTVKRRFLSASSADVSIRRIRRGRSTTGSTTTAASPKQSPAKSRVSSTNPSSVLSHPVGGVHKRNFHSNHHHHQLYRPPALARNDYSTGLFIANLPSSFEDLTLLSAMRHHFGRFGRVVNVKVRREVDVRNTGRNETWGWVWLQDEAAALRALAAAPNDPPLLDRHIRVERARAHRSITVKAIPPARLVQQGPTTDGGQRGWAVCVPAVAQDGDEDRMIDIESLLKEYGQIEEVSVHADSDADGQEDMLNVRFAHRDDSISALNNVRQRVPEIEVTWTHNVRGSEISIASVPGPSQPDSTPGVQASASTPPRSTTQPVGFQPGRGGYRGSHFSSARARGSRGARGRGGFGRTAFGPSERRPLVAPTSPEEPVKEESLRPDEWPTLPGVKTPTRLRWDQPTSESASGAVNAGPSMQARSARLEVPTPRISLVTPPEMIRSDPQTRPDLASGTIKSELMPTSDSKVSPTGPTRLDALQPSSDSNATVTKSVPVVPARALSTTTLQKSNSLPLPLAEDDGGSADGRSRSSEIRANLQRQMTPPPSSVPPSHETPRAKPTSDTVADQSTPGLSQGTASPSSPVVSTPLGGGVPLSIGSANSARQTRGSNWEMDGEVLIDPNAVFVGGLNKVEMDDARLRVMFEQYGTITDLHHISNAPRSVTAFAFITYESKLSAAAAVSALNGQVLDGNRIRVQLREVQVSHNSRATAHPSAPGRLWDSTPTRPQSLHKNPSSPLRSVGSRPAPVPVLVPVQHMNPPFSGLPSQHQPFPLGWNGSRMGMPLGQYPAMGGEPLFASVHHQPPMMRPDGLPYGSMYPSPPWMYGMAPPYAYPPPMEHQHTIYPSQPHPPANMAQPASAPSTASIQSAPHAHPPAADQSSTSFGPAQEMQPMPQRSHTSSLDYPYPTGPHHARQVSGPNGSEALAEQVREIQAGQGRPPGRYVPPDAHAGSFPPPPSATSAYRSAFASYPQAVSGRPGHEHQASGGSAGSDRPYHSLTPVGGGFPAYPPPHPTPSAASSHYTYPALDTQPSSPYPYHPPPSQPFYYNQPPIHPMYGDAYPTESTLRYQVAEEGQGGLEPSPFISSPLDPEVAPFDGGERNVNVGPIGAGVVEPQTWVGGEIGMGQGQQYQQQQLQPISQ